jgi:glycosyltransferase involved in cell wall biosynthesis
MERGLPQMRVYIASVNWDKPETSFYKHAVSVVTAMTAVGIEARPLPLGSRRGEEIGGFLQPILQSMIFKHPRDGFVQAMEFDSAWRNTTSVMLSDMTAFRNPEPYGNLGRYWRFQARRLSRKVQRIITHTVACREDIEKYLGPRASGKTVVVGTPFPSYDLVGVKGEKIGWVGTSDPEKGLVEFLQTMHQVPGLFVKWTPHPRQPAWNEAVYTSLQQIRPTPTMITRPLSEREMDEYYAKLGCLVSTAKKEGFHMPMMEAYLRGISIVVPRIPPYVEQYHPNSAGVFWYDELKELPAVVDEALHAPLFAPDDRVVARYSYQTVGKEYQEIYDAIH